MLSIHLCLYVWQAEAVQSVHAAMQVHRVPARRGDRLRQLHGGTAVGRAKRVRCGFLSEPRRCLHWRAHVLGSTVAGASCLAHQFRSLCHDQSVGRTSQQVHRGPNVSELWDVRLLPAMRRHILQQFGNASSLEEIMSEWQTMSNADRGVPVRKLSTWAAQGNFLWSFWWVALWQAGRWTWID
jgi:hypothetical protein